MTWLQHLSLLLAVSCVLSDATESEPSQRTRRQFPGADWIPLTQPCPTCRPLTDPADIRPSLHLDDIGLVPPRPPITSRQIHSSTSFFPQNSPLLQQQQQQHSVFPPPRQYQDFQLFNQFPQSQFFSPQQQSAFLPQTYLNNPQLLLNDNPQLLPLVNNPQLLLNQQQKNQPQQFGSEENKQEQQHEFIRFKPDQLKSSTKPPQNIRLDQQKPVSPLPRLELPHNAPPSQFFMQGLQQSQQPQLTSFQQFQQFPSRHHQPEQQPLLQVNTGDPFLSNAPFINNNGSDIQIPGLEKEEIQLLYVPVETLRQRGQLQGHTIDDQKSPFLNNQPFQQLVQQNPGHFITQAPNQQPTQFGSQHSSVTPPPALTQSLPLREPPQQFATEKPVAPTTTEKVVTIQPRPVSTIRQQSERFTTRQPQRPTETRTPAPLLNSSPFLSNDHFSQVTQNLRNEVTSNFLPSSPPPSFLSRPTQQDIAQVQPQRHRFGAPLESITEAPIATTTLQPHQPPLSVYMALSLGEREVKVSDVLKELKGASSIAVLDSFAPGNPKVFVGPANLPTPPGVGRFDLPYLSNLNANRIERKVDLPFFVAPLNFNPPEGYSKIPFPAPHVGSVVVATETSDRSNFVDPVTTPDPYQDQEQLNSVEPEVTTSLPETTLTTTVRTRGRRPSQYRGNRRPVANNRQRVTPRPLDEDTTLPIQEEKETTREYLRETQEERKRPLPRRQRVRTTTEPIAETVVTDEPSPEETLSPIEEVRLPEEDTNQQLQFNRPDTNQQLQFNRPDTHQQLQFNRPDTHQQLQYNRPDASLEAPRQTLDFNRRPSPPVQHLTQPLHQPLDFHPHQSFDQRQRIPDFGQHDVPTGDFNPPPPPSVHVNRRPQRPQFHPAPLDEFIAPPRFHPQQQQQQQFNQPQFEQAPQTQEVQGLFEVPPPPTPSQEFASVDNNGGSGFYQPEAEQEQVISTEAPRSVTEQYENTPAQTPGITEQDVTTDPPRRSTTTSTTTTTTTTETPVEVDETEKVVDIPKRTRYNGLKTYPSTGSAKVRSQIRSRQRNSPYTSTTTAAAENEDHAPIEPTGPSDETSPSPATENARNKYISHFNRSRKPLRPTTAKAETTTSAPTTRAHTVRPLRRTTPRVGLSTKRIRKPTTPAPIDNEEEIPESAFSKRPRPDFSPSAASNEVYDEQPTAPVAKPKARKPYYKHRNVEIIEEHPATSPSPSTRIYQERKDDEYDEPRIEESRGQEIAHFDANESQQTTLQPSGPSGEEFNERKNSYDERKKATDPELNKKGRRRLRVRVQKRPQDKFETAESQSHGTVNNVLVPPAPGKATAPDLYRFSHSGEFDFESSGKFIGTQQKGHVRNITTDILENTSTFSSPGTDTEVHQVTIASESTTYSADSQESTTTTTTTTTEESSSTINEAVDQRTQSTNATTVKPDATTVKPDATTVKPDTTKFVQDYTATEAVDTTTNDESSTTRVDFTTTTTTEVPEESGDVKKQSKVVRTSMTTQVSHETEICYKGKCIKTNSDNPDKALRQLVESANQEERNVRT